MLNWRKHSLNSGYMNWSQAGITSDSILVKLNSSSSWGKTALAWTFQDVEDNMVSPLSIARNLGVKDDGLSFTPNITAVAWSYRFALYNIRRIQSFLTKDAAQLPVQALVISRLDCCSSLLAGLSASATKPLQRIQNAAPCFVSLLPKFSHVTPLYHDLHRLPAAANIQFKMMVLAFKAINGAAPVYLQTLVRPHAPARALHSCTSASRLSPPQQSRDSSLFWHLSGGMNSRPVSEQGNHSPSSAKDSFVQTSSQSPPPKNNKNCKHLYVCIISTCITALLHFVSILLLLHQQWYVMVSLLSPMYWLLVALDKSIC